MPYMMECLPNLITCLNSLLFVSIIEKPPSADYSHLPLLVFLLDPFFSDDPKGGDKFRYHRHKMFLLDTYLYYCRGFVMMWSMRKTLDNTIELK